MTCRCGHEFCYRCGEDYEEDCDCYGREDGSGYYEEGSIYDDDEDY